MADILIFPAASSLGDGRAAASDDVPDAGVAAPFREWLDPNTLPAIIDDRPDCAELLRANAVPDEPVSDWWIVAAGALAGLLWAVVFVAVKGGLL
jgi:hypothetical protein